MPGAPIVIGHSSLNGGGPDVIIGDRTNVTYTPPGQWLLVSSAKDTLERMAGGCGFSSPASRVVKTVGGNDGATWPALITHDVTPANYTLPGDSKAGNEIVGVYYLQLPYGGIHRLCALRDGDKSIVRELLNFMADLK